MELKIIFALTIILINIFDKVKGDYECICPTNPKPPSEVIDHPNFQLEDVIIDEINYGKPSILEKTNYTYLPGDAKVGYGISKLSSDCPKYFRIPTKEEMEKYLNKLGDNAYEILTDPNGLNMNTSLKYFTSTKTYPEKTSSSDEYSYYFYGITFNKTSKKVIFDGVRSNLNTKYNFGKCILSIPDVKITPPGIEFDLEINKAKTISIDPFILRGYIMRFQDKVYINQKDIEVFSNTRECHILDLWGKTTNGSVVYTCQPIYFTVNFKNDIDSEFSLNKISMLNLNETFTRKRKGSTFFAASVAQISPKDNGGYYMIYQSSQDNYTYIVEFDSEDNLVKNFKTEYKATPMDIIETNYGFGIYARYNDDNHHSFIAGYFFNYTKKFYTTIMNNGYIPEVAKEALIFHEENGTALMGTDLMYDPHAGKLAYGKGKLNLIFSHYNNFFERGIHTGDTYYSFDHTGSNITANYAWGWQTSHSLIQAHFYDGRYFVTSALCDTGSWGVVVDVLDVLKFNDDFEPVRKRKTKIYYKGQSKVGGPIIGTEGGNSRGRLGGLINLGDCYGVVYSINQAKNQETEGIFLSKFILNGSSISVLEDKKIISGESKRLIHIRAAKWGSNIFIMYAINNTYEYYSEYPRSTIELSEDVYYLIADRNGNVLQGPIKADKGHICLPDEIRPLLDGSLRWAYVDLNNTIHIMKLEKPIQKEKPKKESGGLSGGAIAAIIIVSILVVGGVGFFLVNKFILKTTSDAINFNKM